MIKPRDRQGSFLDAEYICERALPVGFFYKKFRELVLPLMDTCGFEDMYCRDTGRPAIPPGLMAAACLLQFYRGYSDREMEDACKYDLQIKYALGLEIDERPFDHSSLGDFRQRLLDNGREKELFNKILGHLVDKGLIRKDEVQRIDSTHVIADIAVPTTIGLIKKGISEALKLLKNMYKETWDNIAAEINVQEYSKEKVKHDHDGRPKEQDIKRKLVDVVMDAKKVLRHTAGLDMKESLKYRIDMLKRILNENIAEDENGKVEELANKAKPKDLLVSPVDVDARFGVKSAAVKFTGYKANVTESVESRYITNILATRGNVYDGSPMAPMLKEAYDNFKLLPPKVIGDAAYGSGENRKSLKEMGMKAIAPLYDKNSSTTEVFSKAMFEYNKESNTLKCPKGHVSEKYWYDSKKVMMMFHFPLAVCAVCEARSKCTNSEEGRRVVGISPWHEEQMEAERYNRQLEFKTDMKLRCAVEGKLSELKRYHEMRRARYRSLQKVGLQFFITAAAVNIKRWISNILDKLKPKNMVLLPT